MKNKNFLTFKKRAHSQRASVFEQDFNALWKKRLTQLHDVSSESDYLNDEVMSWLIKDNSNYHVELNLLILSSFKENSARLI